MSAFSSALKIEEIAKREILPWLQMQCERITDTSHSEFLQKICGDYIITKNLASYSIELKAEESERTKNLFLETWSNRSLLTPGWMITCRADWLFYLFLDTRNVYAIKLPDLQGWAFGRGMADGCIYKYPEKPHVKREQMNDTWGRCVPIAVLEPIPLYRYTF